MTFSAPVSKTKASLEQEITIEPSHSSVESLHSMVRTHTSPNSSRTRTPSISMTPPPKSHTSPISLRKQASPSSKRVHSSSTSLETQTSQIFKEKDQLFRRFFSIVLAIIIGFLLMSINFEYQQQFSRGVNYLPSTKYGSGIGSFQGRQPNSKEFKIPQKVRCGNTHVVGIFSAQSFVDYYLTSSCSSGLSLMLFNRYEGDAHYYSSSNHQWISFGHSVIIEFLFAQNELLNFLVLHLPSNQRSIYLQMKAQIRVFGQEENGRESTHLLEADFKSGFYENFQNYVSLTLGCLSSNCFKAYNKYRLEITCEQQVTHRLYKILVL